MNRTIECDFMKVPHPLTIVIFRCIGKYGFICLALLQREAAPAHAFDALSNHENGAVRMGIGKDHDAIDDASALDMPVPERDAYAAPATFHDGMQLCGIQETRRGLDIRSMRRIVTIR